MNPEKDQIYIFNNDELSLIKNTFAENEPLLFAIRKVLLQFELNDGDKALLKLINEPILTVLRKRMLPELSNVFPLGQLPSLMSTLTQQLQGKDVSDMELQFDAKQLQIDYLEQQFNELSELAGLPYKIKDEARLELKELGTLKGKPAKSQFVHMTAYLFLLGYIDPMLIMIKTIAGKKDETLAQLNERLKRDSNK